MLGAPEWVGLENFRDLFVEDDNFRRALFNSIRYLLVVPVIAALSLALSLLVEPALPGMGVFRALFYIPVVTMMVVVGLTWKIIFNENYGVLNGLLQGAGIIDEPSAENFAPSQCSLRLNRVGGTSAKSPSVNSVRKSRSWP